MSILEHEVSPLQSEVLVETPEELLLLTRAMNTVIAEQRLSENTDEHKLRVAEAFREQIGDDVVKLVHGENSGEFRYITDDPRFVLEAIEKTREKELTEQATAMSVRRGLSQKQMVRSAPVRVSTPSKRAIPIVPTRITSFYDPRLDEKPRRWHSRLTDIL